MNRTDEGASEDGRRREEKEKWKQRAAKKKIEGQVGADKQDCAMSQMRIGPPCTLR
eukprot:NODE_3639_length_421_cov_56.443548_g3205_i0.p4 GENE.NODE_3639_length_421_cov_56.443548_g3205_i0~~NODE_3639_length_421_cov_56.443548_g3205_i0.p4  ORF type:complete len:56 (+),score=4.87 NODE_3639_length_421_cov_56.443548_g3205_i0:250-417(+)